MTNAMIGIIQAVIVAIFGVLQVFGIWTMTDEQRGAVLTLYGAVAALAVVLNTAYGKAHEIRDGAKLSGVDVPKV